MTEFILDHGTPEAARWYGQLDAFTQGYVEAMFFTETGTDDDSERDLETATVAELSESAWAHIVGDCTRFQATNADDLSEATNQGRINGYDDASAGRDFWYTRNGHGVGYWSRRELEGGIGNKLSEAAKMFRETDLYRGDDGRLYLS